MAEDVERAIIAEIGELGERELAAVKAWIAGGCEGPKPRPDVEARCVLTERLIAAIEAREAAEKAANALKQPYCVADVKALRTTALAAEEMAHLRLAMIGMATLLPGARRA